uniref:Uncharacterized protein n=1 Tax=Trepomonas sp. PC1 TaxID=1076344 RepID=A0A146JZ24_9EUKA|eukprot:JAP89952.1 Hypothetical protein TPC1_30553 [Trepomonas sp. PC1]
MKQIISVLSIVSIQSILITNLAAAVTHELEIKKFHYFLPLQNIIIYKYINTPLSVMTNLPIANETQQLMNKMDIQNQLKNEIKIDKTLFESEELAYEALRCETNQIIQNNQTLNCVYRATHSPKPEMNDANANKEKKRARPGTTKSQQCDRRACVAQVAGKTIIKNSYRYDYFFYRSRNEQKQVIETPWTEKYHLKLSPEHIYYRVEHKGDHDQNICARGPYLRIKFTEQQEQEIEKHILEFKNLSALKHLSRQVIFNNVTFRQLSQKANLILREKISVVQLCFDFCGENNIRFKCLNTKNVSFGIANPDYYQLFIEAKCKVVEMDWTFIKIGHTSYAIHILASILPSRFMFILAAYIVSTNKLIVQQASSFCLIIKLTTHTSFTNKSSHI